MKRNPWSQIKRKSPNHLRTSGVQRNSGRLAIAANLGEVSILFWKGLNLPRTRFFLAVMIFSIDWPLYIAGYCLGSGPLSCNGSNHCWEKLSPPHIICCVWHWANIKAPSNITKQPNYVDRKQNLAPPQSPTNTSRKTKDKTTNTIKPSFNEGNQNLAQQQQKRYRKDNNNH